jgi:hypothetical protein
MSRRRMEPAEPMNDGREPESLDGMPTRFLGQSPRRSRRRVRCLRGCDWLARTALRSHRVIGGEGRFLRRRPVLPTEAAIRRFRSGRRLPLIGLLILSALLVVHGPENSPSTTESSQSIMLGPAVRPADAAPSVVRGTAADGHERLLAGRHHAPVRMPQVAGQVCLGLLALTFLLVAGGLETTRERAPIIGAAALGGAPRPGDRPCRPPGVLELSVLRL